MSSLEAERSATADTRRRLSDPEFRGEFGASLAKADFAIVLALARRASGLTQEAVAQLIGVKQSYIAKLEGGDANPTIGAIGKLLALLGRRIVVHTEPLEGVGSIAQGYWDPWTGIAGLHHFEEDPDSWTARWAHVVEPKSSAWSYIFPAEGEMGTPVSVAAFFRPAIRITGGG